MVISTQIKECADKAMKFPTKNAAYEAFWDELKNRIGQIPSSELAACTKNGLFNMDKNCFELTLLIPFPQEMLNPGIGNEVPEYRRKPNNRP